MTNISPAAFNNYGYIGLGYPPYLTNTGPVTAMQKYYTGEMDELRIWHMAFMYTNVELYRLSRIITYNTALVSHWSFNDGEGDTILDAVSQNNIRVIHFGVLRTYISWRISSLPLTAPYVPYLHTYTNLTRMLEAETTCNLAVYNSSLSACSGLGTSLMNLYYVACVSDIAASYTFLSSMYIVVTMSDHCWLREELTTWPGIAMCNYFETFPGWKGASCNTKCNFPATDNATDPLCSCRSGYWGASCDQICPGGTENACSYNGKCDQATGKCVCQYNWNGPNCDSCADGWYGQDCSVNVQPVTSQNRMCSLSGNGHLSMLDGSSSVFEEYGYFTLYKTGSVEIQIETMPCGRYRYCVIDVIMKADNRILAISAIAEGEVMLDGVHESVYHSLTISSNWVMSRIDSKAYRISGPSAFRVDLFMNDGYINLQLMAQQSSCSDAEGICGTCADRVHACSNNDGRCLLQYVGMAKTIQSVLLSGDDILYYYNLWHKDYSNSLRAQVSIEVLK